MEVAESNKEYNKVLDKNLKYSQDKIGEVENVLTTSTQIKRSLMGISVETMEALHLWVLLPFELRWSNRFLGMDIMTQ